MEPQKDIVAEKEISSRRVLFRSFSSKSSDLFKRANSNPILKPTDLWWESEAVFNPAAAEDKNGVIHIIYRAIGKDGISRFGYAKTKNGEHIDYRSIEPVFESDENNEFEEKGVEDPRLSCVDGQFYMTYTAASKYKADEPLPPWLGPDQPWRVRVSMAVTKDFKSFSRHGVILPEMDNKDAVLFPERVKGKFAILHRLPPDIWIAYSDDLVDWDGHEKVTHTRPGLWDERRIGTGAPPIKTPAGWLVSYHGSDHHNVYRAGFLLLDLNDPSHVLGRSLEPSFEPVEKYEREGLVPRVVFPEGLVLRGDELLMYYGGADKVVGLARGSLKKVIASLR
jgi:predicted GH43/DUF377 family glycosyl hydrolase